MYRGIHSTYGCDASREVGGGGGVRGDSSDPHKNSNAFDGFYHSVEFQLDEHSDGKIKTEWICLLSGAKGRRQSVECSRTTIYDGYEGIFDGKLSKWKKSKRMRKCEKDTE